MTIDTKSEHEIYFGCAEWKRQGAPLSETDYFLKVGRYPEKGSAQYKGLEHEKEVQLKIQEMIKRNKGNTDANIS